MEKTDRLAVQKQLEDIRYHADFSNIRNDPSPDVYAYDVAPITSKLITDAYFELSRVVPEKESPSESIADAYYRLCEYCDVLGTAKMADGAKGSETRSRDALVTSGYKALERVSIIAKRAGWKDLSRETACIQQNLEKFLAQ